MPIAADEIKPILNRTQDSGTLPRAAIFLSGSGSNAERLLEHLAKLPTPPLHVAALVTDAPESSRAREIGRTWNVPVVENDIRAFYKRGGETRVTLATPAGRQLREAWTQELRQQLQPLAIDFGILAGFVPLTNLTGDFPCLNVHPGDLTYRKDGQRYLVGLHTVPIERAILEGLDCLRSSVIQALPYTGRGDDMDNGPLLGISDCVAIDLKGADLNALQAQFNARPAQRPAGGYGDALETLAKEHQEKLKTQGDWIVLPRVVVAFAQGRYALDKTGELCFRCGNIWHPVETVIFSTSSMEVVFRE